MTPERRQEYLRELIRRYDPCTEKEAEQGLYEDTRSLKPGILTSDEMIWLAVRLGAYAERNACEREAERQRLLAPVEEGR